MTRVIYKEGDLVFAFKKYNYDSPQYEWCTEFDYPLEYAFIMKIDPITSAYSKYYVKFVDGAEDCLDVEEMKFVSSSEKISREQAASPQ
jgi:hypothetical protein